MSNALPEIGSFVRIVTSRGPVNFRVSSPYYCSPYYCLPCGGVDLDPVDAEDWDKLGSLYSFHAASISAYSPNWVKIELDNPNYGAPEYQYDIIPADFI